MKRTLFVALMICCLYHFFADKPWSPSGSASRQFVRVSSSLRGVRQECSIITSTESVKIVFPSLFELKKPIDFIYETVKKDRVLILSLKMYEVRTYKLQSFTDRDRAEDKACRYSAGHEQRSAD